MKNNLTLLAREGKAKSLQNTGGGTSYHKELMTASNAADVKAMSYGASIEHPLSIHSASIRRRWETGKMQFAKVYKYVACLLLVLFVGVGNVWGATITWNTADNNTNNDVTITTGKNATFTGDDASTVLTYTYSNGCKRLKNNGGLSMNGASQYNNSNCQRYLTFKAPSSTGTVSLTLASINGKTDGTGTATVRIYGGTTVAYDVSTLNSSLTSPTIHALQSGTSDIIITFSAKCIIKEVKWTDVAVPSFTTVYANNFTASPMGVATVAYSNMSSQSDATSGWIGWASGYTGGYKSSSSSCSATLTFATPLELNSDGTDCGRIRIYWGHVSNNKNLGLKVNGSSVSFDPTTVANTLYPKVLNVAEYVIPKTTTTISSIVPSGSSSTGTYLFRIEVLTHSSCSAPTSPTITAIPASAAYTAGDNISLTASATGTDGSTTYTWYKGTTWDAASATSSIGSAATFTKNSCVEGDAGTYWCNISNGTGCEVQVSKTITVAAAAKAYTVTAASNNDSYGTAEAAASALDEDETTTVTATAEDGYKFVSWAVSGTDASLSSTTDNPTTLTMGTANATVTATFRALSTYTMSYAKGSAEGVTGSKDSETKTEDAAFTLPSDAVFELDGYVQTGWATSDGGDKAYDLGGSYTTNSDQAFYPVWTELKTITYHANGGSGSMSDTKGYGSTALRTNTFTNTGYVFAGWATSQSNANSGTIAYSDGANVPLSSEDVDLYAIWYTILYSFTPSATSGSIEKNAEITTSEGGEMTFTPLDNDNSATMAYGTYGILFGGNSKSAVTVSLNSALATGNIIQGVVYSTKNGSDRGLKLISTESTTVIDSWFWSPTVTTDGGEHRTFTYTVPASGGLKDASAFRLLRQNNAYLKSLVIAEFVPPTAPSFTSPASEPATAEYYVDETVDALEVTVTGEPTPTLQWYKNSSKSTSGAASISGATNASYTPSSAAASDFYYYCVATNVAGSAQSEYFRVTVSEALTFDATYSSAKGTAPDAAKDVSNVTLPTIDPVTGFVHTAWTADKDVTVSSATVTAGTEIAVGTQVFLTANTTFTAVWSTAYTLTLDPKGGTIVDATGWTYDNVNDKYTKAVVPGGSVDLPVFTKDDRTFKTWRNNADAEDEYAEEGSVTVSADMTLNAIWNATVEQVIYSWESPDGTPVEFGGTAKYYNGNTDASSTAAPDNRVNFANKPINGDAVTQYYTLRLDKATDYSAEHVRIALDAALAEGDKIKITAYQTKSETKDVAPKIANASNDVICSTSQVVNLYSGGTPTTQTKTLNASAEGATTLKLTRSATSTTVFITKLQIVRDVTTEESNLLTVTFNSNGGSSVAAAEVVSGNVVAKPANPTKSGYRFKEWQLSGSAYDFSTAVTANITLDAVWTQLYAVTYVAGGGSGSMAADEAAAGDEVTLKANGFTAPDGKVFDAWVVTPTAGGDPITVTAGKFTMPAAAVTATATWKATYTVNYIDEDGSTPLGSEEVAVGSHPTAAGISAEKDFKTLTWLLSSVAVELDEVSAAAGDTVELVASYTPTYASSINIEQWILDNRRNNTAFRAVLDARNYRYSNLNDLDSLTTAGDRNEPYLGQKIKKTGGYIQFLLKAGSELHVKFGNIPAAVNLIVGSADPVAKTASFDYTAGESDEVIKLATTTDATVVFKQIMIDEAIETVTLPWLVTYNAGSNGTCATASALWMGTALTLPSVTANTNYIFDGWSDGVTTYAAGASYTPTANITLVAQYSMEHDNRLSSLEFNGEELDGFDPDKGVYYTTVPYSTTLPKVTDATLVDGEAEFTIQDAIWDDELGYYIAQVYVTPVAGSVKFYQVRYTMDPKQGVSIIKVMIPNGTGKDQEIAAANITGYIGGTAIQKIESGDHKLGSKGHYIGITLAEGTFQENDLVNVNIETVAGDKLRVFSENTAAEAKVVAQSAANMVAGVNTVILGATTTSSLYLRRGTDGEAYQTAWNPFVGYFEVQRYMDPIIKSFKVGDVIATIDEEADPKTITLEVPYSTDITSLIPEIEAYANGGATITPSAAQDFSKGAVDYTITSAYGETTTYAVTISKAEASHDAALSALSVAGYNIGFEASKLTYNVELPKGSVIGDLPVVSYTKNHTGATAVKTDATALPGSTTIVVTAEDESTTKTYTINFTVGTMDKYVIFSGQTDALEAVPVTPTGLNWEKNSDDADRFKFIEYTSVAGYTNAILTGGSSNASRNISVTIPADYEAVFEIAQASNSDAARHAYVGAANNTGYADALFSIESTSKTDGQKAKSDVLAGGKTYYIHSDNSINILELNVYLDRVSETPVISAEPADMSVCEYGTDELTVTAAVSEGTLSYQWYKEVEGDDDETVGMNSASYAPAAAGKYYVIITNTQGTYKPSSVISEVATVTDQAVTAITTAPEDVRKDVGEEATLTVVATGKNLSYEWFTCDDAEGTNPVAIVPAETGASLTVTVSEGEQYYMVVVSSDCGEPVSAVAKVAEWREVPQANVTESITWDWTSSAWPADKIISFSPADGDLMLLANVSSLVPANSGFRADMLLGSGQYIWRDGGEDKKCFQGNTLKFHTEVAGAVTVYYRSTSSGKDITININGTAAGHHSTNTYTASETVLVPANSDVEITKTGETYIRINKIVFQTLDELTPDYTRDLTQGYYGTICLPNGGIMTGAMLFELAYFDATQQKIFFDEILNGVMVAGTPYIFLPKEGASQLGVYYTDDANAPAGHANGLYGSYTLAQLTADDGNYILYNNKYYFVDSENVWVGENRAYIKLGEAETVTSPAHAPKPKAGCRRISMGAYGEEEATGIGNLQGDQVQNTKMLIDGQLFIICGDKMYDATGKQVK